MRHQLKNDCQRGMTLIELMVVIAVVAILAAVAIPNFVAYRNKTYCGMAETDGSNIMAAMAAYFSEPDHTQVPSVADLALTEDLSLNNGVSNVEYAGYEEGDGFESGVDFWISVYDDSGRCPRGIRFNVAFGASQLGYWD